MAADAAAKPQVALQGGCGSGSKGRIDIKAVTGGVVMVLGNVDSAVRRIGCP
jgi:hypothetical protein